MKLFEIPWSHNCIKVRIALDHKRLDYDVHAFNGVNRLPVKRASGQTLVPVLVDGDRAIADSTAILLHLDAAYPDRPLIPADPEQRAECLVLEAWADSSFMRLTRRLGYANVSGEEIGELFFPNARPRAQRRLGAGLRRVLRRRFGINDKALARDRERAPQLAQTAVDRLAGRPHLVGDGLTIADIALATMVGPLVMAAPETSEHPAVRALTDWSAGVLGPYGYTTENLRRRSREALAG